jgi:hypothetical protein
MMKDWAISFLAASFLIGMVIWCVKVLIWAFYVG